MPYCEPNWPMKLPGPPPSPDGFFAESTDSLVIRQGRAETRFILIGSAERVTVFVKNTGQSPISAWLQNSPNAIDTVDDPQVIDLAPGEIKAVVPYLFSRFIRLAAAGPDGGQAFVLFQIQRMCRA